MDFSYTIFPVKKNKCWKNFDYDIFLSQQISTNQRGEHSGEVKKTYN
jgi:hypothetical protein